jgi:CheY-like chemotaxis protein
MRVLVAHSDVWTRHVVAQSVLEAGCTAIEVSNGSAALRVARRELPDVVILGPTLAEVAALDVLGSLRADPRTRAIRVLMLSMEAQPIAPRRRVRCVHQRRHAHQGVRAVVAARRGARHAREPITVA